LKDERSVDKHWEVAKNLSPILPDIVADKLILISSQHILQYPAFAPTFDMSKRIDSFYLLEALQNLDAVLAVMTYILVLIDAHLRVSKLTGNK